MRFVFSLVVFSLISIQSIIANNDGQACLTHGECQKVIPVQTGQKCLVVKTGVSPAGNFTCALRCYRLPLGSYCKKIEGSQIWGLCKKEKYEIPSFDPSSPNCDNAIDPI